MDRKKKVIVSSTPFKGVAPQVMRLFSDIQCSPITGPQTSLPMQNEAVVQKAGAEAVNKRKVPIKRKAPESVAAGVLNELGVEAQDICNNALSHSRNLYHMFPEPIILDSDDESSLTVTKQLKKTKQDSKVVKSTADENQQEKKTKELVPGGSRSLRLVRSTRLKTQPPNSHSPSSQESKNIPKSKLPSKTKSKLPSNHESNPSVFILDDDDDSFPVHQPGTSVHRKTNRNKIDKVRPSLELDEKFPIEWTSRSKKRREDEAKNESVNDESENENSKTNSNKQTIGTCKLTRNKAMNEENFVNILETDSNIENVINKVCDKENMLYPKERGIKVTVRPVKKTIRSNRRPGNAEGLMKSKPKCSSQTNKKKEHPILISRFQDVTFNPSKDGGIIARCIKTNQNSIGYLEVPVNKVFKGEQTHVTFVVLEGEAKVAHLGMEQTLLAGDMIHIKDNGGYSFSSVGSSHVRFLYMKELR